MRLGKPQSWRPGIAPIGLTQGLVVALPFWEVTLTSTGRPRPQNLVTGEYGTPGASDGGSMRHGRYGVELFTGNFPTSMPYWNVVGVNQNIGFTMMAFVGPAASTFDAIMFLNDPAGAVYGGYVRQSGTSDLTSLWRDATGATTLNTLTSGINQSDNVVVASLIDNGTQKHHVLMGNGRYFQQSGFASRTCAISRFYLGTAGGNGWDNQFYCAAVWKRLLSIDEMQLLCADPFILFRRPKLNVIAASLSARRRIITVAA